MSKSKKEEVHVKAKPAKVYTRAQAERAISSGSVPPEMFLDMASPLAKGGHPNYHVKAKAWRKMGTPVPEGWSSEDLAKFWESIHVKNPTFESLGPDLSDDLKASDVPT